MHKHCKLLIILWINILKNFYHSVGQVVVFLAQSGDRQTSDTLEGQNLKIWADSPSPQERKVSIMICAPLKKSPNCASQSTRCWGLSTLNPYSNPSTASSLSGLLATYNKWMVLWNMHMVQLIITMQLISIAEPWTRVWQSYTCADCVAVLWPKYGKAM